MVDLYSIRVSIPFGIRKDAQPPQNGAFATMDYRAHYARGVGG